MARRRRRRDALPTPRSASPTSPSSRSGPEAGRDPGAGRGPDVGGALRLWLVAARPRALPAAVAPGLVGTAPAGQEGTVKPLRFACALVGSVLIQIGPDPADQHSHGPRRADT